MKSFFLGECNLSSENTGPFALLQKQIWQWYQKRNIKQHNMWKILFQLKMFSIITVVFSVTLSFRNQSKMMICRNVLFQINDVLLNFPFRNRENVLQFSRNINWQKSNQQMSILDWFRRTKKTNNDAENSALHRNKWHYTLPVKRVWTVRCLMFFKELI